MDYNNKNFFVPIRDALLRVQDLFNVYQKDHFPQRSPQFFALELCGEVGELANMEKKLWKGREEEVKEDELAEEAADAFIALLNYSNARGIDLANAVYEKLLRIEQKRQELERQGKSY